MLITWDDSPSLACSKCSPKLALVPLLLIVPIKIYMQRCFHQSQNNKLHTSLTCNTESAVACMPYVSSSALVDRHGCMLLPFCHECLHRQRPTSDLLTECSTTLGVDVQLDPMPVSLGNAKSIDQMTYSVTRLHRYIWTMVQHLIRSQNHKSIPKFFKKHMKCFFVDFLFGSMQPTYR